MRNNAQWLPHSGWLRSSDKVGLIYHDIPNVAPSVEQTYLPALKAQGINPEVIKLSSDSEQGLSQITAAVNQFKRDGVTFVIPVMNLIYKSKFQQDANSQAYKPRYDESDIYFGCSAFTTTSYDKAGQFNGTRCLTSTDDRQYTEQTNAKHPSPWVKLNVGAHARSMNSTSPRTIAASTSRSNASTSAIAGSSCAFCAVARTGTITSTAAINTVRITSSPYARPRRPTDRRVRRSVCPSGDIHATPAPRSGSAPACRIPVPPAARPRT